DNVINIDFIRSMGVLHEVKKSRKIEEASILQVKYYLYYLKQRDVSVKAQIDYPLLKQNIIVELQAEDEIKMEQILDDIKEIVAKELPIKAEKKSICKSCAFYDLCFI
ncbi:MAG: Dna2/Cas4 domain-containing protein, partial [Longicatena sp.]